MISTCEDISLVLPPHSSLATLPPSRPPPSSPALQGVNQILPHSGKWIQGSPRLSSPLPISLHMSFKFTGEMFCLEFSQAYQVSGWIWWSSKEVTPFLLRVDTAHCSQLTLLLFARGWHTLPLLTHLSPRPSLLLIMLFSAFSIGRRPSKHFVHLSHGLDIDDRKLRRCWLVPPRLLIGELWGSPSRKVWL